MNLPAFVCVKYNVLCILCTRGRHFTAWPCYISAVCWDFIYYSCLHN